MTVKLGINGFGAIGRRVLRVALQDPEVEVVAVNDLSEPESLLHLLKYDSTYGTLPCETKYEEGRFVIDGKAVDVYSEKDPARIPWEQSGVEIVIESTGIFTEGEKAAEHLQGSVKKVIISAPAKNHDLTVVMGVNDLQYDSTRHHVISNASCTTNCLAPMAMVLDRAFGIVNGMMCTVHSYTNDQHILDFPHKDWRRARSGATSIIPTTTGAAVAVAEVLPHLSGRLNGMAMRVPTPAVSVVDFTVRLKKKVSAEDVNRVFQEAANSYLEGIMDVCTEPLVSLDFKGVPHSTIIDALSTQVVGDMVKVVGWYDNEWGYSNRVVELARHVAMEHKVKKHA
ncbi:type I glyceraldehyde-3-phosphate dehydrogenase [Dethiobacter alkaliphilus]|uniref:type I glyceraldehyde-3-phosphate dehydrogenase n=1 Tax=Dethiobacter alkaliphilus TaxID=427926 RepID=UPI00222702B3|nr:type I glyceraldehyde-3-phosphate dehydrogenase [Dethiobacter alkaliphilus]MCW3489980.1 type I glyceraldehyde-3-phosphate dehydrogenase [Dethiobacter alkaliphilus]